MLYYTAININWLTPDMPSYYSLDLDKKEHKSK